MNQMNIRDCVEVENKKNDYLSVPCYPLNRQCLSRKIQIEKGKKKEKNKDRTQTK